MTTIRPAAVAGMFYPDNPGELGTTVEKLLESVEAKDFGDVPADGPKAVIAPHAGYIYSGMCAAGAYRCLALARKAVERVVILGPVHRVPVDGLVTSSADFWRTPLGDVPVDVQKVNQLTDFPQVTVNDRAHSAEHSIEVHLPFLQSIFPEGFSIIPLLVGRASPEEISEVIEYLWDGPETRFVVSSDLSHYLGYNEARALDAETAKAIEQLEWTSIGYEQACGRLPISGMLKTAVAHDLRIDRVALCNSGDTAGPKDRVVGYGSWILG